MRFSTKAETLDSLQGKLKSASILPLFYFSVKDWEENPKNVLKKIDQYFPLIISFVVRSSSQSEDLHHQSNAGSFDSKLYITKSHLEEAICAVIKSYGPNKNSKDQVLIQPMLQNVKASGVIFTSTPSSGAPYYIINYDLSGDTQSITSGASQNHHTIIVAKSFSSSEPFINSLLVLSKELENLFHSSNIDIEFGMTHEGDLYLFQVRPLVIKKEGMTEEEQKQILQSIEEKIDLLSRSHPYLYGKKALFGVMPDWNPAEIIGVRPRPLALSLYKELITNSIWAYQRDNYGYKNLRSFPLLVDFYGLPYIDVRVSFNSFIPSDIHPGLGDRLVNYYLDTLEKEPSSHDKVEFDIVFSCYTLDLPERLQVLRNHDFSENDINNLLHSLRTLTNRIIHKEQGLWKEDLKRIEILKERYDQIISHQFDDISLVYWLIEDCKRYGTLPFAGLARAGFIAIQILNSMVSVGVISEDQKHDFLNSLNSISTKISGDLFDLSRVDFLKKYGHLRPGTYDILSPSYAEAPELYFNWAETKKRSNKEFKDFHLSLTQMKKLEILLREHQLDYDVVGLLSFLKTAIEGREYSKFIFTKNLSTVVSTLRNVGDKYNLDIEDMSCLDIQTILSLYSSGKDISTTLKESISVGRELYKKTQQLSLPYLIGNPKDIWAFELPEGRPNFVTHKSVTAPTQKDLKNIQGTIVFIPSADPGFDWIFSHNISGFITAYGGVNSHMAIRANELGIPAIIGAGEKLYKKWSQFSKLHIDCTNQIVEPVS